MFLDTVVVSGTLHVYVSQTARGELVFGASTDPYPSYSMRGSLEFTEELAGHILELMPSLAKLRVLRQWAGLCDMTPDFSPIMGVTPVEGFLVDVGWGTYGFKAGPAAGEAMDERPEAHSLDDAGDPEAPALDALRGLRGHAGGILA